MKGKIWRLSHMGYTDAFEVLGARQRAGIGAARKRVQAGTRRGVAAFQKALASQ